MGRRQRQFRPPEDFCRGLRSAGNGYGLWPRFHDARVPNGQCGVNSRVQAKYTDSGEDGYFVYFLRVFEKSFRICRQGIV